MEEIQEKRVHMSYRFAQLIYKRRQEKGLTLKQVSIAVGVSANMVQKWETGMIETIRPARLGLLIKALDIPEDACDGR